MTKADKIYKVKCTYDMSSKNITFGMMPIRYSLSFNLLTIHSSWACKTLTEGLNLQS